MWKREGKRKCEAKDQTKNKPDSVKFFKCTD